MPSEREKLTTDVALLLEVEGEKAEEGGWKFGTREAILPQGGQGQPLPAPFHPFLLSYTHACNVSVCPMSHSPTLELSIGREESTSDQKVEVDLTFHSVHMTF